MPELPSGFDRADGLDGRIGTATPAGAIEADTADGTVEVSEIPIQELPDSPTIERAEQATLTHRYQMSWEEALTRIAFLGRGVIREDSSGNLTKMLSASIQHERGGTATLTTVDEGMSFDNPPDQFQITPIELGVNIIKHPRYFYAFLGDGPGSETELVNQMVVRMLQNYFENPSSAYRDALQRLIKASIGNQGTSGASATVGSVPPPYAEETDADGAIVGSFIGLLQGTDLAKYAALEIIQKYWRGIDTPYIVGYQITHSTFYFMPQYLNPGGYIENPITEAVPELPAYFWSPVWPPDGRTIFDALGYINPQCYSTTGAPGGAVNISWMRKADEYDYERTWFKVTRTWIGSAIGFWDTELYSASNRPTTVAEFLAIN